MKKLTVLILTILIILSVAVIGFVVLKNSNKRDMAVQQTLPNSDKKESEIDEAITFENEEKPEETISNANQEAPEGTLTFQNPEAPAEEDPTIRTDAICDDIDLDGNLEYVSLDKENERVHVVREKNGEFYSLGTIETDDVIVEYMTNVSFIKVDQSGKKYIFITLDNFIGGVGFLLYGIQGDSVYLIEGDFPSTTGSGTRTLEDKDNDEIYKRVDYTGFNDYQGHVKAVYYKWDGQGFIESDEKMLYSYGEFTYPEKPEDVVECFISASCLGLKNEMDEMAENTKAAEFLLSEYFYVNEYGPQFEVKKAEDEGSSMILIAIPDLDYVQIDKDVYFKVIKVADKWKVESVFLEPLEAVNQ